MPLIAHWPVRIQGIEEDMPSNMFSFYQIWTTKGLLNILIGPPNHNSQNSPDETHELGSWAKNEMMCYELEPWALMHFCVNMGSFGL